MKANNLLALLMILVVIACNKTEQQPVYTHNGIPTGIPLRTRSGEFLDSTYFVSDVDLSAYLHYKSFKEMNLLNNLHLSSEGLYINLI